ncbi:MAG: hypothetical protein AB7H93_18470 [Vicinamibacterales bacterium]
MATGDAAALAFTPAGFFAEPFAAAVFGADGFAAAFLTGAFLTGAFLAGAFLATAFRAAPFVAGAFMAVRLAAAFGAAFRFATDFFTAGLAFFAAGLAATFRAGAAFLTGRALRAARAAGRRVFAALPARAVVRCFDFRAVFAMARPLWILDTTP